MATCKDQCGYGGVVFFGDYPIPPPPPMLSSILHSMHSSILSVSYHFQEVLRWLATSTLLLTSHTTSPMD